MNLNVRKKMLSLLVTTTLVLNRGMVSANAEERFDQGDHLRSTVNLNIRMDANVDALKIGLVGKNQTVFRILSYDDEWDLVCYDNIIGFVQSRYLKSINNHKDTVFHQKVEDLIIFNNNVNFRLKPSIDGEKISVIKRGERAEVIAKANNDWYLIK